MKKTNRMLLSAIFEFPFYEQIKCVTKMNWNSSNIDCYVLIVIILILQNCFINVII